jgi:hypothetical protein
MAEHVGVAGSNKRLYELREMINKAEIELD